MSTKIDYIMQVESLFKNSQIKPDMVVNTKVEGPSLLVEWQRAGVAQKPLGIMLGSKEIAQRAQAYVRESQSAGQKPVRGGHVVEARIRDLSR